MADYHAFQGDSYAKITDTLGSDVSAYSSVAFVAKARDGAATIERAGSIDGAGSGEVTVFLTAADLTRSGFFDCAWRFDDGAGGKWTVPADAVKVLQVRKAIT